MLDEFAVELGQAAGLDRVRGVERLKNVFSSYVQASGSCCEGCKRLTVLLVTFDQRVAGTGVRSQAGKTVQDCPGGYLGSLHGSG